MKPLILNLLFISFAVVSTDYKRIEFDSSDPYIYESWFKISSFFSENYGKDQSLCPVLTYIRGGKVMELRYYFVSFSQTTGKIQMNDYTYIHEENEEPKVLQNTESFKEVSLLIHSPLYLEINKRIRKSLVITNKKLSYISKINIYEDIGQDKLSVYIAESRVTQGSYIFVFSKEKDMSTFTYNGRYHKDF